MKCPKCKGEEKTKNGFKNGVQRYKCKTCGCNYTRSRPHGYLIEVKRSTTPKYHVCPYSPWYINERHFKDELNQIDEETRKMLNEIYLCIEKIKKRKL